MSCHVKSGIKTYVKQVYITTQSCFLNSNKHHAFKERYYSEIRTPVSRGLEYCSHLIEILTTVMTA